MPVAAVILAAGASRRLGQPKQLVTVRGEVLLARAIRLASEAAAEPVIAVLGAHFAGISAAVSFKNAFPAFNSQWQQGMASSIHAGLRELDARAPQSTGALLMACDQPRLTAAHLRTLLEAFSTQPQPAIAASFYADALGIPAVFPRAVFDALLALKGDKGARALLIKPLCPLVSIPFAGGEIDIDSPEDLDWLI
ncbi:MAG TPA: nucleotidyltransferase family protein [Terracidiphilus sp.]|jgi:molybdenum cofactor cytidylyltransferase|nr:nucleotidyltransferase family protein [Terracidiphilus sp.]